MMASELEFYLFDTTYSAAFDTDYRHLRPSSDYRIDYHLLQPGRDENIGKHPQGMQRLRHPCGMQ